MHQCQSDYSVFFLSSSQERALIVYVDDIIIIGDDQHGIDKMKAFIQRQFHTKDLRELRYFLGIEVSRSKDRSINLNQRKYVLDIFEKTRLLGTKPIATPMDLGVKLYVDHGELMTELERYRRLVGKLTYLCITCPGITFIVNSMSQFMSAPRVPYWEALLRMVKYLKNHPSLSLCYRAHGHLRLEGFTDSNWARDLNDRRCITGYCIFLRGNLVS
ncbi:Beta-galactosidase 8 [Dionaea muscipula]